MNKQLEIDLTHPFEKSYSGQVILEENRANLNKQSNALLKWLLNGDRASIMNCSSFGVSTLHSRTAEVRKYLKDSFGVVLQKQYKKSSEFTFVSYYEYYLLKEDILKINLIIKNN